LGAFGGAVNVPGGTTFGGLAVPGGSKTAGVVVGVIGGGNALGTTAGKGELSAHVITVFE